MLQASHWGYEKRSRCWSWLFGTRGVGQGHYRGQRSWRIWVINGILLVITEGGIEI